MTDSALYGLIAGILLGAGVGGHALRLVALDGAPWGARNWLALAAMGLYLTAAVLVLSGSSIGLVIAIVGPVIGLASVVVLASMGRSTGVDAFQAVLGVFQVIAVVLSGYCLITHT